jgi:hypothetical protein
VVVLLVTACSGGDNGGSAKPSVTAVPCAGMTSPPDEALRLPDELPPAPDLVLYRLAKQGSTRLWFGHAPGPDVVTVRDDITAQLAASGFTITSEDEEPPAEAELQFSKPLEGSVQVTPLCDGRVQIRYRVSS